MSGSNPPADTADVLSTLAKPGAKTSEFLALVAMYAGVLATLLGAFNTSNPRANAILKSVALIAAAVAHLGYALSRGKTKQALSELTGDLAHLGVLRQPATAPPLPPVSPATPLPPAPPDTGAGDLTMIGGILIFIGVLLAVLFSGSVALLVIGLAVAVIGLVLVLSGRRVLR